MTASCRQARDLLARLAAVHLAPMGDASDDHEALGVLDRIDDAVVTDADPVVVAARESRGPGRAGYVRASDHGTAESRSSRAWRAARLSSRYSSRSISSA